MDIDRIGIVGLGLIGGSLALALRRARPEVELLGVDSDAATRQLALSERAVSVATALEDADLASCEMLVLALPAEPLLALLPQVAARMKPGTVLTDVCGSKERICAVAAQQTRVTFVGGHPMAGTEHRGFKAAHPLLFERATVVLCPPIGAGSAHTHAAAAERVRALWTAVGAEKLLDLSPEVHDEAVTFASHLPYLAAAAVVEALRSSDAAQIASELAAGGFRDTTRLAGDGTISGAASLNRFVPGAARKLARSLRELAELIDHDATTALSRLSALAEDRRQMKLPRSQH
ncbi:MAG TPA: prephenate dehydrogenase/arogenate dehydrogenase family protein [Myxococcales bacterium]|jgi:prephenate dehydrogenase